MPYFQTNSLIKIRFPSRLTKGFWTVEEKLKKTTFAVPKLAVYITLICSEPRKKHEILGFLRKKGIIRDCDADVGKVEKILDQLVSNHIITSFTLHQDRSSPNFDAWKSTGWDAAAHYHSFTWDVPFLNYSEKGPGYPYAKQLMLQYHLEKPDNQRFKSYDTFLHRELLSYSQHPLLSLKERLHLIFLLAFTKMKEVPCHWSEMPLIRRTSPSGGSRHPTEGYFLSKIEEIPPGLHHIQMSPPSLVHLSGHTDTSFLEVCDDSTIGYIILTSIFERNMYKYRGARSFRVIHIDVGHIIETIEQLGVILGIKTLVHFNFSESRLLEIIGISKFEEGVMAVISMRLNELNEN